MEFGHTYFGRLPSCIADPLVVGAAATVFESGPGTFSEPDSNLEVVKFLLE